ncbi:MAG: hypothetical protein AB2448_08795 [Moorella sp. (in: firmicutes)]
MQKVPWRSGETNFIRTLTATVDVDKLLAMEGGGKGRRPDGRVMELYNDICREAIALAQPAFAWAYHDLVAIEEDRLSLQGGKILTSRFLAAKLASAQGILVMLATIGPRLEARVKEYQERGDALAAYLLDMAGSALVESVYYSGFQQLELETAAAGLEATTPFGPGHSYWDNLADQEVIFSLVDAGSLGMMLTDTYLMLPRKSISGISGVGRGFTVAEYHCHYCHLRCTCPLSKARRAVTGK